jgi:hypothetical protein
MRGKRVTMEKTVAALKEAEAGAKPKDLCRKHGISVQKLYNSLSTSSRKVSRRSPGNGAGRHHFGVANTPPEKPYQYRGRPTSQSDLSDARGRSFFAATGDAGTETDHPTIGTHKPSAWILLFLALTNSMVRSR